MILDMISCGERKCSVVFQSETRKLILDMPGANDTAKEYFNFYILGFGKEMIGFIQLFFFEILF